MPVACCLQRVCHDSEAALRGAVEVLITEVFGDTERNLAKVRDSCSGNISHVWSCRLVSPARALGMLKAATVFD